MVRATLLVLVVVNLLAWGVAGMVAAQDTVVVKVTAVGVSNPDLTVDPWDTAIWANLTSGDITIDFPGVTLGELCGTWPPFTFVPPPANWRNMPAFCSISPGAVCYHRFCEKGTFFRYYVAGIGDELIEGTVTVTGTQAETEPGPRHIRFSIAGLSEADVEVEACDLIIWRNTSTTTIDIIFSGENEIELCLAYGREFLDFPIRNVWPRGGEAAMSFRDKGVYTYRVVAKKKEGERDGVKLAEGTIAVK